ncbi:uncharacterized protein LOC118198915 isoform X2 [Stegodyphus dumicola]|uniref:uncharacterized protein LOC118198915 isoform X2 n=1 Tax=Stegodyphus dumicola TaxID=202533 RepID=UPI0015ADCA6A|nr:uncharacterized protein LOC118198915 isoform X2 [Stegodyphus dumicola]
MLYCFQNEKVKQDFKRIFNNDICFKQKKERGPQTSEPSVINGSASQESNAQEFWRLGKEKCNSSKVNTPLDSSPAVPSQSANNETGDHMSQNMFWMSRGNLHQQPDYYSETNAVEEQDVTPSKFHTSQSPRHQDQCHHFFILSQKNGQFMDHIYETIDDEPTGLTNSTTVKSNSKNFQSCQRSPPAENYYGYHSDLSQHSSSSYGYDQQPLLVVGGQNRQNTNQTSYPIPKENQIQQFIKEEKVLWEANQNISYHTGLYLSGPFMFQL